MLSGSEEVSSKRVISFISLFVLIGMIFVVMYGKQINETLIYVFASFVGGTSVLSTIE